MFLILSRRDTLARIWSNCMRNYRNTNSKLLDNVYKIRVNVNFYLHFEEYWFHFSRIVNLSNRSFMLVHGGYFMQKLVNTPRKSQKQQSKIPSQYSHLLPIDHDFKHVDVHVKALAKLVDQIQGFVHPQSSPLPWVKRNLVIGSRVILWNHQWRRVSERRLLPRISQMNFISALAGRVRKNSFRIIQWSGEQSRFMRQKHFEHQRAWSSLIAPEHCLALSQWEDRNWEKRRNRFFRGVILVKARLCWWWCEVIPEFGVFEDGNPFGIIGVGYHDLIFLLFS